MTRTAVGTLTTGASDAHKTDPAWFSLSHVLASFMGTKVTAGREKPLIEDTVDDAVDEEQTTGGFRG